MSFRLKSLKTISHFLTKLAFKENIIKLTDYPFIYSVLGSIFIMSFHKNINPINTNNPFNEFVPILIFIGIFGTIFSIIDPFGRSVKYVILVIENYKILIVQNHLKRFIQAFYVLSLRDFIEKIRKRKQENRKIDEIPKVHLRKLLNTTWINYEIDKLVSTFYFIIALFLLIFILGNPIHFETYIKFVSPPFEFNKYK